MPTISRKNNNTKTNESSDSNDDAGKETLKGTNDNDVLLGSAGNDLLKGKKGDDFLDGSSGNDNLDGGADNDTLIGGAGSDQINGGQGDDEAVYTVAENQNARDVYKGGDDVDTLTLQFTNDEWFNRQLQDDVANYLVFLDTHTNTKKGVANGQKFQFQAFDLEVSQFEKLRVIVDGVELNPADEAVTPADDTAIIDEDDLVTSYSSVLSNDDVPDLTRFVRVVTAPESGVLNFNAGTEGHADGSYTFDPAGDLDWLGEEESTIVPFTYEVEDADGDIEQATVAITVTGTNDIPSIASADADHKGGVTEEASTAAITTQGTISFQDLDLTDTHTADFVLTSTDATANLPGFMEGVGSASANIGTFSLDAVSEDTADQNNIGTLGWNFALSNDSAVLQSLTKGQTISQIYTVTITDKYQATVTQDITVTITGTNDAPVIQSLAADHVGDVTEDSGAAILATDGVLRFQDIDLIDTHQATFVLKSSDATVDLLNFNEGEGESVSNIGTFALDSAVTEDNNDTNNTASLGWNYTLDNTDPVLQSLAVGQTITQVYAVTITDNNGDSLTQDVAITLAGTNDIPVAVVDAAQVQGNGSIEVDVLANDLDVDSDFIPSNLLVATGTLEIISVEDAKHGVVSISADGSRLLYAAGETAGVDYIKYTVRDQWGLTAIGTAAVVINAGTSALAIGTGGADIIDVSSVIENQIIIGGLGDDTITAGSGDDLVLWSAGDGNDVIDGGEGFDEVSVVLSENEINNITVSSENGFVIVTGQDFRLQLDGVEDLTFVGGETNTTISIGDLVNTDIADETITFIGGVANETYDGSAYQQHQEIFGFAGNDILKGGAGNDLIDGGTGVDTMSGGAGDDEYIVDNVADQVSELNGQGDDVIKSSVSYYLPSYVENLELTGSAHLNATGNSLNNLLKGNSGENILDGGAGADTLMGGFGHDDYYIDNAGDVIVEVADGGLLEHKGGLDVAHSSINNYTLPGGVEGLRLVEGSNAVSGFGNAQYNTIVGNSYNNVLHGNGGDDAIYGGAGHDTLIADTGQDVLYGGEGNDYLDGNWGPSDYLNGGDGDDTYVVHNTTERLVDSGGIDTVLSEAYSYTLERIQISGTIENLTLIGTAKQGSGNAVPNVITGNDESNELWGYTNAQTDGPNGAADNDILIGNGGIDILHGGNGADTLYGGEGDDILWGDRGADTLWGQNGNDTLHGGDGDDYVHGGNYNDVLYGDAGNDFLFGGWDQGSDTLIGGDGNDTLDPWGGNGDALYGGNGNDVYYIHNSSQTAQETEYGSSVVTTGVDIVLSYAPLFTLSPNIENLNLLEDPSSPGLNGTGNAGNNTINGNSHNNILNGMMGSNTLNGGGGNDILEGAFGGGTDYLNGGDGDDVLFAGGYDTNYPNYWDQLFNIPASTDYLTGGAGADVFHASNSTSGTTIITDFVHGVDKLAWIRPDSSGFPGFGELDLGEWSDFYTSNGDVHIRTTGVGGSINEVILVGAGYLAASDILWI